MGFLDNLADKMHAEVEKTDREYFMTDKLELEVAKSENYAAIQREIACMSYYEDKDGKIEGVKRLFDLGVDMLFIDMRADFVPLYDGRSKYENRGTYAVSGKLGFSYMSTDYGKQRIDYLPAKKAAGYLQAGKQKNITVYQKDKSVIGSAAAGAVIAGEVGAVVGAASAINTNAKGGETKVSITDTNDWETIFLSSPYGKPQVMFSPIYFFFSNRIVEQYGKLDFMKPYTDEIWDVAPAYYKDRNLAVVNCYRRYCADLLCPSCGAEITPGHKFCTQCGFKLQRDVCPSCGAPVQDGSRFCMKCGYKL